MRAIPWRTATLLAFMLVTGGLSAQTIVNNIALANPSGVSAAFFQNGNGTADYLSFKSHVVPDPDNFPDNWSFTALASSYFKSATFTLNSDPDAGASFRLTLGTDVNVQVASARLFIVVSGLEPLNPDYQLSDVEFSVQSPYNAADFSLKVYPELDADNQYGSFYLTNSFFDGVLAIAVVGNFSFLMNTNIVINGTFDAIDTSAVPEPAVAALGLAIGAAGFVAWRRRAARTT